MAITEPHSKQQGDGGPPVSGSPGFRRHPRRRWILLGLGMFLAAALVILAVLAGTYQPVQFAAESGAGFPGLPTGTGLRTVNTFGAEPGQMYVPPQRGVFHHHASHL